MGASYTKLDIRFTRRNRLPSAASDRGRPGVGSWTHRLKKYRCKSSDWRMSSRVRTTRQESSNSSVRIRPSTRTLLVTLASIGGGEGDLFLDMSDWCDDDSLVGDDELNGSLIEELFGPIVKFQFECILTGLNLKILARRWTLWLPSLAEWLDWKIFPSW